MPTTEPYEVCKFEAHIERGRFDGLDIDCRRCGRFRISRHALILTSRMTDENRAKLSGWVREQSDLSEVPLLTRDRVEFIERSSRPALLKRADRILEYAVKKLYRLTDRIDWRDPAFISVSYSLDDSEAHYILRFMIDQGWLALDGGSFFQVTPAGYMRFEGLRKKQATSSQGFIAMSFDQSLRDIHLQGFEIAIQNAGYDPLRVDGVEHIGKIDDEIIAQIRRSRFVVADFTGQRNGVYFEAGFALGLNLPVFWTCKKDHMNDLHFDIRQFNCIDWDGPDDLVKRLQARIEALIGRGPGVSLADLLK